MNTKKETSKNQKCICDESGLNEETRADIGHFKKCPRANIPNQIILRSIKKPEINSNLRAVDNSICIYFNLIVY